VRGVAQSALNLEILAPYMPALDADWPAGGEALREVLAPYNTSRNGAALLLTDIVHHVDQISAGADLRHEQFQTLPEYRCCTRTERGQWVKRVLPPPEEPQVGGVECSP